MNIKNSLNTQVFQDEHDFSTLENLLSCLDHVSPKKITRSEYEALQ